MAATMPGRGNSSPTSGNRGQQRALRFPLALTPVRVPRAMATVRVMVLAHRPGDVARARELIADPVVEGRVVVGDADGDAVQEARENGLLVTLVDPLAASDGNAD